MSSGQSYTTSGAAARFVAKPPPGTTAGYVPSVASDGSITWGPQTGSSGAVSSSSITDATTVGKAVLVASTAAVARTAIGAGTASSKTDVGLGNVDNVADVSKPLSAASIAALALKANSASPTFTGTVIVPTVAAGTNDTQAASTAFVTTAVAAGGGGGGGGGVGNVVYQSGAPTGAQITAAAVGTVFIDYTDNNHQYRVV